MIPLSLPEYMIKKLERQLIDIKMAGQLWDIYENHTSLMNTMREMCVVGIDIMLEHIEILKIATGYNESIARGHDIFKSELKGRGAAPWQGHFKNILSDSIGFLDCFGREMGQKNAPLTNELLLTMKRYPQKWFSDVGKVGGFFRGFAETAENSMTLVFIWNPEIKKPVEEALKGAMKKEKSLTLTKAVEKLAPLKAAFRGISEAQKKAIITIIEREEEGRLSHQKKLVRRGIIRKGINESIRTTDRSTDGRRNILYDVYDYSAEWFGKWQRKGPKQPNELTDPEAQLEKQRAREGVPYAIPNWIRPLIKLPKHLNPKKESSWQNAGIFKWSQMEWDRLWLIAQLYGLPPGATISGTTTDHMFTIYEIRTRAEQLGNPVNVRAGRDGAVHMKGLARRIDQYLPYLHLIPLIQMGSQMHHSICEMATALSLNDFIRYHVGYYTSLLPDQVPQRGSSLDSKIRKVLKDASMQAPHVYAVGSKSLRNAGLRKVVAYQVNMANKRERDAHRQKALLNPETASAWEGIPTDINLAYVKNKARTIEQ